MNAKTIAAIAFAASTLLVSATAEAGYRNGGNYGGNHERYHNHYRSGHYDRYDRPSFGFYVGDYEPYKACRYLKTKARYIGSHFWWRKYKRCIVHYY